MKYLRRVTDGLCLWLLFLVVSGRGGPVKISRHVTKKLASKFVPDKVHRYLATFGYLPMSDLEVGNLRADEDLRAALMDLQAFAGIPRTGELDSATVELLKRKRCGNPDFLPQEAPYQKRDERRRVTRYTLQGQRWPRLNLTWSVTKPTNDMDIFEVRNEIRLALSIWSRSSRLTFSEKPNDPMADLVISFYSGYHGDGYPFDGKGAILAHAFYPSVGRGGDVHFDDEEIWTTNAQFQERNIQHTKLSLFTVAAHEIGHSLGLSHSSVQGSLMFPWYSGIDYSYNLHVDDARAIQQLYGDTEDSGRVSPLTPRTTESLPKRPTQKTTSAVPTDSPEDPRIPLSVDMPDSCDTPYDAAALIRNELFIFKGKYFWRVDRDHFEGSTPFLISRFWYGLPSNMSKVDAVYERPTDLKIVFFVGNVFYVFVANSLVEGPRSLTEIGLPAELTHLDAAMVWSHNGKTYFFSGSRYWRFDEETSHVELDYPRPINGVWKGIPNDLDAVTQWPNAEGKKVTYFFKGKGFWEFEDIYMSVRNEAATLSAPFWLDCPRYAAHKDEESGSYQIKKPDKRRKIKSSDQEGSKETPVLSSGSDTSSHAKSCFFAVIILHFCFQ